MSYFYYYVHSSNLIFWRPQVQFLYIHFNFKWQIKIKQDNKKTTNKTTILSKTN